jgi:hypothetical protein
MKTIYKSIYELDKFGKEITFHINGKNKHKTYLGGYATLSLLIISLYLFFIFGKETFNKLNPRLDQQYVLNGDNTFNMSKTSINVVIVPYYDALTLSANINYTFDPTRFNILFEYSRYANINNTKIKEFKKIPTRRCNKSDFDRSLHDKYDANRFDMGYCMDSKDFNITGLYESNLFEFLKIAIIDCNHAVSMYSDIKLECKNRTEILKNLPNWKFSLYLTYSESSPYNYENPFYSKIINQQIVLNTDTYRRSNIYFSPDIISTDDDWIFNNPFVKNNTYTSLNRFEDDFSSSQTATGIIFYQGYIRLSEKYSLLLRTYKKIPIVLAEVVSIFSNLNILMVLFFVFYNYYTLNLEVANNHIDDFDLGPQPNRSIIINDMSIQKINIRSPVRMIEKNNNKKRFSIINSIGVWQKKKEDKSNRTLYHSLVSKFYESLDINNYINLYRDVTMIKNFQPRVDMNADELLIKKNEDINLIKN